MAIRSCQSDSNCGTVRDPSLGHCPMGLGRTWDLRWMEKMAGVKGETDDQAIYSNALRTGFARKHPIKVSVRMWWPKNYRMFCVWWVVGVTGMDVAMFLSAPCTLGLYCEAGERAQGRFHPVTDQAPPPTRRRRLVSGRREKASWPNVSLVSTSSTLRGQFPSHSSIDVSRLVILTKTRCEDVKQFIDVTCTMAMNDGNHLNISGVSGPPRERGELIAVGLVAMATKHGGRQAMLTDGEGFPIGGWSSGMQEEPAMETWTVRPLYQTPLEVGEASEGGWRWCANFLSDCSSKYCKKYCELQLCAA